jgi:RNA recognition motif-containing protein
MEIIEPRLHEVTLYIDNRSLELIPAVSKVEAKCKITSERNRKLYVGGLPPGIKKEELKQYFGNFGTLEYANPVYSPGSTPRGFAFIKYVDEEDAMKVLRCKNHIIRGSCIFIKESKTRQEVSSKKIDKMTTVKIIQGKESPNNTIFRNYNQSEIFTAPPEDSVSYQGYSPSHLQGYSPSHLQGYSPSHLQGYSPSHLQGYSPSHLQGYSHEDYYCPSIVNSSRMNENLYSQETAYQTSFGNNNHNNGHNSWQISPENMQMSNTPNPQNNIMSQKSYSKKHSQFGKAYIGQSHGQGQ